MSLSRFACPIARIGIIGGGQLGRMMVKKAHQLGCYTTVLDPVAHSPAGQIADKEIIGTYFDQEKLRELVQNSDVTTFDLENIDAAFLTTLAREGHVILPDPVLLQTIQDKGLQKQALEQNGLPTAAFVLLEEANEQALQEFGYPLVQKARRGGYDGKGVAVLLRKEDAGKRLPGPCLLERYIPFDKELAVLVARNKSGACQVYPVSEMVFVEGANVMDMLIAPARITAAQAESAQRIAKQAIEALEGVGLFGVELFLTREGEVLINEISPRTHNSGHYTIEACVTDQFEQHLRAITGLPLGDPSLKIPSALINLLGEPGYTGTPMLEGLAEALAIPGVSLHWYGKNRTSPFRKMGHVTIVDRDLAQAQEKALRVKSLLRITASS